MAENISESKHLASLDFDISQIPRQLEQVEQYLRDSGQDVQKIISEQYNFNNAFKANAAKAAQETVQRTVSNTIAANSRQTTSMLQEIASKTRWYIAGTAAFGTGYIAKETIQTLTEVEYKVMEITRVMNDASLDVQGFRDKLFGLAMEYGRSFEDVSEVALRFAQAGYNVQETLSMTRDSLLALNTAELDVQNSTQSMIGIMQQWNFTADELSTIIDRINYTADNNAITSQDLVDGLLVASSVAKTANMSFDQTVGVLTALKEASGRTGKEVGNAFKSILTYIQRPKSLEGFDAMGIEVFADKATGTLLPMMDILTNMSTKWSTMSTSMQDTLVKAADEAGLFSEELAIATGTLDEYNSAADAMTAASDRANDAETRAQANLAAGVYRRNYYIALMENMQKALQVTADLQNAEGYSMQENSKHLDTLKAKYTQLIESLKALAVQLGEAGLMDAAKDVVEIATAIAGLTKDVGGLKTVVIGVASALMIVKSQQIGAEFDKISSSVTRLIARFRDTESAIKQTTVAAETAGATISSAIGLIGLAITSIMAVVNAVESAQAKARQNALDAAAATMAQTESLEQLKDQYIQIVDSAKTEAEKTAELTALKEQLAEVYGIEKEALDKVNTSRQTGIDLLNAEIQASRDKAIAELAASYDEAKQAIDKRYQTDSIKLLGNDFLPEQELNNIFNILDEIGAKIVDVTTPLSDTKQFGFIIESENLIEQIDKYNEIITYYSKRKSTTDDLTSVEESLYQSLIKERDALLEIQNTYGRIYDQYNELLAQSQLADYTKLNPIANVTDRSTFDTWLSGLVAMAGESEPLRAALEELAYKIFPQYTESATQATVATQSALDAFIQSASGIGSSTADVATGLEALESALQKTEQGMSLTADEVFNLISLYPELAGQVKLTADGYYFESDALNTARVALLNKLITEQMALAVTEFSKTATDEQRAKLDELVVALNKATTAEATLTAQTALYMYMAQNATSASGGLADALNKVHSLIGAVQSIDSAAGGGGSSWAQKRIEALRKETKAIQDEYEKQIKAARKAADAIRDSYNDQINAIKERYDAEIKWARRAKEERDRNRERADIQEEIEYWSKRTGVEAFDKLKDAQKKLREKEEDWSWDDYIQGLEDARDAEVKRLEELRDAEIERYEAEIKRLEELKEAETEKRNKEIEALQQIAAATTGMYEAMQKDIEDTKKEEAQRFSTLKEYGGQVFGTWTELYSYARKVAEEARLALQRQAEYTQRMAQADSWSEKTRIFNERQGYFPSSHTGSYVAKEGLVNVAPGEIIIRPDITAGLLKMVNDYNRAVSNVTNNSVFNTTNSPQVFIQGPLNNIEKQEIHDTADKKLADNSVVRTITKELQKLTRLR